MSDFKREERYVVIKLKTLSEEDKSDLRNLLATNDIETIECVVVEHDWPNYEATWKAIQQVSEGTYDPDEITTPPELGDGLKTKATEKVVVTVCYREGCSDWEPMEFPTGATDQSIEDTVYEDLYTEIHCNPGFRSYSWKRLPAQPPKSQGGEG